MDLEARKRWEDYIKAKEIMLKKTHIREDQWRIVPTDDNKEHA